MPFVDFQLFKSSKNYRDQWKQNQGCTLIHVHKPAYLKFDNYFTPEFFKQLFFNAFWFQILNISLACSIV